MQVEALTTERDKLAGQNVSLAAAFSASCTAAARTSDTAAGGVAHHAQGPGAAAGGDGDSSAVPAAAAQAPAPRGGGQVPRGAQLKELGHLMQRLTQDNAALLRQR
jgi:hypothetical protein